VTESDIILAPGPTITAKCTAATNIVTTKQVTNAVTTSTNPASVTITKTLIYTATMTFTCIPPSSLTSSQLPPISSPAMRHWRPTPAPAAKSELKPVGAMDAHSIISRQESRYALIICAVAEPTYTTIATHNTIIELLSQLKLIKRALAEP
jgi:hypothetical protein